MTSRAALLAGSGGKTTAVPPARLLPMVHGSDGAGACGSGGCTSCHGH
jgi:hypothetical protein